MPKWAGWLIAIVLVFHSFIIYAFYDKFITENTAIKNYIRLQHLDDAEKICNAQSSQINIEPKFDDSYSRSIRLRIHFKKDPWYFIVLQTKVGGRTMVCEYNMQSRARVYDFYAGDPNTQDDM